MPRRAPEADLVLPPRPANLTLTRWLYEGIRSAILEGRLHRRARLPATREFALQHGVSRRIAVNVFEQLQAEGYLTSRVGAGTTVSGKVPEDFLAQADRRPTPPTLSTPAALPSHLRPIRAFNPIEPALSEFPMTLWARIAARVNRRVGTRALSAGDPAGLRELRQAISGYLGASRGVACSPDHIVIVSGTQQSLDLLARLLLAPGDPVWFEDPAYTGAVDAFRNARARIVPVRVDEHGLPPALGRRLCPNPKAVYLTPAHQFGLGVTLSLDRRLDLIRWAQSNHVALIEDDYDSEFRFLGRPVPAIKGLDDSGAVFLLGTFNKSLFPGLRLGYMVVPDAWLDRLLALRHASDRYPPALSQMILARFMADGHFARHLRRMRELYGARRAALQTDVDRYLRGVLRLPETQAGLNTPAFLLNGMTGRRASDLAAAEGIDAWPLDQFALQRRDLRGLILGFAAFTEPEIRTGVLALAKALS